MDDVIFRLIKLKSKGFCCAQIMLMLALEAQGKSNAELVRSVGGLCFGIHGVGEACGALSGGACLLSLYTGKGSDDEEPDPQRQSMLGQLIDWFGRQAEGVYGGTRCNDILEKFPDRGICGQIVVETYGKCLEILAGHGFDPAVGKRG